MRWPSWPRRTCAKGGSPRASSRESIDALVQRDVRAQIWNFRKRSFDYRIYVTDARGIVVYDSARQAVGKDYSRWNDVYLTLRGKYGARSTSSDPGDKSSSVMYVAAPIRDGETIIGVADRRQGQQDHPALHREQPGRDPAAGLDPARAFLPDRHRRDAGGCRVRWRAWGNSPARSRPASGWSRPSLATTRSATSGARWRRCANGSMASSTSSNTCRRLRTR